MKNFILALLAMSLIVSTHVRAEPANTAENKTAHESEAGVILTSGNAPTQSYNLKHMTTREWTDDLLKFNASFLRTSSRSAETARNALLALRYERSLWERLSVFASQSLENDPFAGLVQRYNTDVGGKYFLYKEDAWTWTAEAGYRYSLENRFTGRETLSLLRLATEAKRDWTPTFGTRVTLEFLPNLTSSQDYQINGEIALNAAMNEVFAVKTAYSVRYRNVPVAPATISSDTQFTTALVAKY